MVSQLVWIQDLLRKLVSKYLLNTSYLIGYHLLHHFLKRHFYIFSLISNKWSKTCVYTEKSYQISVNSEGIEKIKSRNIV